MSDAISHLQSWFSDHCNGEWEHQRGILIQSLDNPGWSVTIDLRGTTVQNLQFIELNIDHSEDDWIRCWVDDSFFQGRGDPKKLERILAVFLDWATQQGFLD